MKQIKKVHIFLTIWIFGWSYLCIDQVSQSIDYINSHRGNVSSVVKPGYKIVEKNGNKFLIRDKNQNITVENSSDEDCLTESFLNSMHHDFNYENNLLTLTFSDKTPLDYKIHKLNVKLQPDWQLHLSNGNKLHNVRSLPIPTNQKVVEVDLQIYDSGTINDINILLNASGKHIDQRDCVNSKLMKINAYRISNLKTLQPYNAEKLIAPIYQNHPNITELNEFQYLRDYVVHQKQRLLYKNLPAPHEASIALMKKDIKKHPKGQGWVWNDVGLAHLHYRSEKTVIGLFGHVVDSDIQLISNLIDALTIVAPNLQIKYSSDASSVNLPIYMYPCDDDIDYQLDCSDYAGVYFPNSDWIFVDVSVSRLYREHVIVHELGHALGLGHNLCKDSVMSYSDLADPIPFFDDVDLMQLQVLYSDTSNIISGNNLDEEKIEYYEANIHEACSVRNKKWGDLIELQLKR